MKHDTCDETMKQETQKIDLEDKVPVNSASQNHKIILYSDYSHVIVNYQPLIATNFRTRILAESPSNLETAILSYSL